MNISALSTGFILCASLFFSGCTLNGIANNNLSIDGNEAQATVKKSVKINDFNEIEASQGIKIIYVQGASKGSVDIATTPSAEKYLKVEVKGNTLKAYYANTDGGRNVKIKGPTIINVSSPRLNEVSLSSAAHMSIEGELEVKGDFELNLSSASSFDAVAVNCQNLDAELSSSASGYIGKLEGNLDVEVSSASSIKVNSIKGNLFAEASSAASVNINSIETSSISAEASSASSISIQGISGGNINADASSGAKIKLSGKADHIKKNSSSGGSVNISGLSIRQ